MKILFLSDFVPTEDLRLDVSFKSLLDGADRIVFNLEGSPTSLEPDRSGQIMPFKVEHVLRFIDEFDKKKFIVALANNHILDNGYDAFDSMISAFQEHKVEYFGSKDKPHVFVDKAAILNFVTAETVAKISSKERLNYLFYDTTEINRQIASLESKDITCILYPHWGRDMDVEIFKTYDRRLKINRSKWFIFGHHPHVISGVHKNNIYSLGNTFIPHPFYYQKYPGVRYGIAVMLDSDLQIYNTYLTEVQSADGYKKDFLLKSRPFEETPTEVSLIGQKFSKLKRLILGVLAFKGNWGDLIRLWVLQLMTFIFTIKIKTLKK